MKLNLNTTIYLISYTLVYHALYYCPPVERKFTYLIKLFHGIDPNK